MPNKKNYPKGFSPYCKPYFGYFEPIEFYEEKKRLNSIELVNYFFLPKLDNLYEYELEVSGNGDKGYSIFLTKYEIIKKPNKNYKKEPEDFNFKKEKYKEELKAWKEYKKKWDEEARIEKLEAEKKLYDKLKNKFEPATQK